MNELQRAILDGRTADVRRIAKADPTQMLATTWDGTSVLDLARAKGIAFTEVALIRSNAPGSESISDWPSLLYKYMAHMARFWMGSNFDGSIPFLAWSSVIGDGPWDEELEAWLFDKDETVEDLRFLGDRCGGWIGEDDMGQTDFVSREVWLRQYEQWRSRRVKR